MSSLHRMWREPKVNYSTHRRGICSSNPARVSTTRWVPCIQLFQGSYSKYQSREILNMTLETLVSQMDSNDLWPLAGHIKEPRPQLPIKSAIDLAFTKRGRWLIDGPVPAKPSPFAPWCNDVVMPGPARNPAQNKALVFENNTEKLLRFLSISKLFLASANHSCHIVRRLLPAYQSNVETESCTS